MAVRDAAADAPLVLERVLGKEPEPAADETTPAASEAPMTLVQHLEELRRRLFVSLLAIVVASVGAFFFWQRILAFLLIPLPDISSGLVGLHHQKLIQTEVGEAFTIALKLALAAGVALASPVVLYQVWAFIAPAMTRRERKHALPFLLLGVGLFVAGVALGFVVLRFPLDWLLHFGDQQFTLLLKADGYLTFVAYFLLVFGLVFELPLVLTFMGVVGIVSSRTLRARRMYILFGLWVLSAVATPGADPYSPVIVGLALTALFELTVLLLRLLGR
jgi:sec-independent protein translocase protein TatC